MAELVNKINGPWFSKFDEDLATAFSIYCGISIAHVSGDRGGAGAGLYVLLSTLTLSRWVHDSELFLLPYLLVTSGLSFPSENWGYYFYLVPLAS